MAGQDRGIDRRAFLRLGATASGAVVGGCTRTGDTVALEPQPEMRYRPLGGTGLSVSEISFGTHGFDNPALLLAAVDAGITTICTSSAYRDGHDEWAIGKALAALKGRRDGLVVLTGDELKPGATAASILADIDASLRRLGTDRVELYCTMQVVTPDDLRREALFDAFEKARQAGKVGHLAMSGHHGGMQDCLNTAIDDGRFSVLFTRYDFASYPDQDAILRRATKRGLGTIVFKTAAGNRHKEIADLEAGGLSFKQATVRWALQNPDVASACVSITNFEQVRTYAGAVGTSLSQSESAMLQRYARTMSNRYCRFCGNCEASCPSGVAVADVNRFAMYFTYYGQEKDAMRLYDRLPSRSNAGACRTCAGRCDAACPFERSVRRELVEAHRRLSFLGA